MRDPGDDLVGRPPSDDETESAPGDEPRWAPSERLPETATSARDDLEATPCWQSSEHQAKNEPMRILSDYEAVMRAAAVESLRTVLTEHPRASTANLRELVAAHPSLGKVTLAELFGRSDSSHRRAAEARTVDPPNDGWAEQFAKVLGRQRKKKHTYDSMHELVDRFYLRAVLEEHKTITATARHLKITRVRLRTRLQALGLYDGFED